ncbi:hypothetical protein [Streptomyces sp. NPDC005408]|uniref:hypothetical protein n=1 Tax=Streptomyces sp. NPDC005408 TaxID=3155341 RepID=UPI00339ECC5B
MRTNQTLQVPDEAAVNEGRRPRQSLWAPVLVNLLLGVPAIAPLYCAQWLLTQYLPMDCRTLADVGVATNCDYHTLDHGGPMMLLLLVTGALVLAMALLVDVVLPLARGRRLRSWLGSAPLLLVPYTALWALSLSAGGH